MLNDQIPVLHRFLLLQSVDHTLDPPDLLGRIDASLSESITHPWSFSHRVWHSVHETKLGRQVEHSVCGLDDKHGLAWLSDPLAIALVEVVGDSDLLTLTLERARHRISVKHNLTHEVLALVAPIRDDRLPAKLLLAALMPLVLR